eukprot:TRINITY_DN2389_c0_g1_i1.p1 TRINITY_DN2389_c0_g1~~TRINITY_DN2389_c0_g1_i1.p1  ORF type:complete len:672 (+),score=140.18 TRINITY_DN2389_c0_g1_i1:124-2139(+)
MGTWWLTLLLVGVGCAKELYVDCDDGIDTNTGLSTGSAWKTLGRVSLGTGIAPGDSVLFLRGCQWRGQLVPVSGNASAGAVTYAAYGDESRAKPLFMGSVDRGDTALWRRDDPTNAPHVWTTGWMGEAGDNVLANPSFTTDTDGWSFYAETEMESSSSRDTAVFSSSPASLLVYVGHHGSSTSSVQLFTTGLSIIAAQSYLFSFKAKSDHTGAQVADISLMKATSPWSSYASSHSASVFNLTSTWTTYSVTYTSSVTATDGRLTFSLGGPAMPAGTTLHFDDMFFGEVADTRFNQDVGNIIFNDADSVGVKKKKLADVTKTGDFFFDEDAHSVQLYCEPGNPASVFDSVELALNKHIISEGGKSYVTYDGLQLKYTAAHGIGGGSTHHITARHLDISYIGGSYLGGYGDGQVRYGNGIEFWEAAHDNVVEYCRLDQVYDAALTNQGTSENTQYNLHYRYNIISNSEYCFEYWNRPEESVNHNIYFENNVCYMSGYGWGNAQRPDPSGRHMCFYTNSATTSELVLRNNIFYQAKEAAWHVFYPFEGLADVELDYNVYYQTDNDSTLIIVYDTEYTAGQFAQYVAAQGKDKHSQFGDPLFDNAGKQFNVDQDSPAVDAGTVIDALAGEPLVDYAGTSVPQGAGPDIGAYERSGAPVTAAALLALALPLCLVLL